MERGLGIAGSIASVIGLLVVLVSPGFRDWVYPLPLVIGLVALLAAAVGVFLRAQRRPSTADQKRLDQLFAMLPREAIRRIRYEDFGIAWPDDLMYPVYMFYNDFGDVEHQFDSKTLEKCRIQLRETAENFTAAEAMAIPTRHGDRRYLGIASGELEVASEDEWHRFEEHRVAIHQAAIAFADAHDSLVKEAKQRRFDLGCLDSERPKRSWTGVPPVEPTPVRARWPGE